MTTSPRWFTDTGENHTQWYIDRFRTLAAEGADLDGEARFVDALVPPSSRILDAGCGAGRVAGALHRRGHHVVGVDVDPDLVAAAAADHPGPAFAVADLTTFDLAATDGIDEPFDVVVCAGNVMVFLAPDTERAALERMAAHTRPGGRIVLGFRRNEPYPFERLDADLAAIGLVVEQRFATWHLDPFTPDADFAVHVVRRPA